MKQLHSLLDEYRVPAHIRKHMEKVEVVAMYLAGLISKRGFPINMELLGYACLLHDLVKTCEIPIPEAVEKASEANSVADTEDSVPAPDKTLTPEDLSVWRKIKEKYASVGHIKAAFQILSASGEHEIAKIILKHRFESVIDPSPDERPQSWEEKLLYYADKRVMHDRIVTLEERLKDGRERYYPDGNPPTTEKEAELAVRILENEICKAAGISPDDLREETINR